MARGHYERLPIRETIASMEAYFAVRSYMAEMLERCGKRGYWVYGEKEARGFMRRKDRPPKYELSVADSVVCLFFF
ncbi:unnamed protein product [Linum tenue]|uniref:Uncharacterized protein n=1 Tax=Linum tenue TaxID=586396 RepID=A0AAV0PXM9_9ROSI|nr:unnamed protein product [Linum tenue]